MPGTAPEAGKFLTFIVGGEEHCVRIQNVQEIIGMMPISAIPGTPGFLRGVINLRGRIIPVQDLRLKLGMPDIPATRDTCIVVMRVRGVETGLVVDRVSEVLQIASADIGPAPSLGPDVSPGFIAGIAKGEGRVRILLDIERVLSAPKVLVADSGQRAGDTVRNGEESAAMPS